MEPQDRTGESFNSRPHKEVDKTRDTELYRNVSFNSRPHKEVDFACPYSTCLCNSPFNSRPHKEVDLSCFCRNICICRLSTHDLTRRSTKLQRIRVNLAVFQLTTSQGGRRIFRSTCHRVPGLSTHDLTRRSTETKISASGQHDLSTHDLTRRSTILA